VHSRASLREQLPLKTVHRVFRVTHVAEDLSTSTGERDGRKGKATGAFIPRKRLARFDSIAETAFCPDVYPSPGRFTETSLSLFLRFPLDPSSSSSALLCALMDAPPDGKVHYSSVTICHLLKHLKKVARSCPASGIARARAPARIIAAFTAAIDLDPEAIDDKERRRRLKSERNFASRLRNAMFSRLSGCQAVGLCASRSFNWSILTGID